METKAEYKISNVCTDDENEHISDELRIYTESAENEHIAHVYFEKEYLVAGRENVVLRMRIEELESEIRELQE